MSTKESGDDHHQETLCCQLVKSQQIMLGKLVESQSRLVESQSRLVESQELMFDKLDAMLCKLVEYQVSIQPQMTQTSRNTIDANSNHKQGEEGDIVGANPSSEDVVSGGVEEITQVYDDDDDDEQRKPLEAEEDDHREEKLYKDLMIAFNQEDFDPIITIFALRQAAVEGDWGKARKILKQYPTAIKYLCTYRSRETVLHVAAEHEHEVFVEEALKLMPLELLEFRDQRRGLTALHIAAIAGNLKIAEMLVTKNPRVIQIRSIKGTLPLEEAVLAFTTGQRKTVEYLYSVTKNVEPSPFTGSKGARLLVNIIDAGFYDIATSIVWESPELVDEISPEHGACGLEWMIQRPFAFLSGSRLTWWQRCIYSLPRIKQLSNQKLMHKQAATLLFGMLNLLHMENGRSDVEDFFGANPNIIKTAIRNGTVEFVATVIQDLKYLVWCEIKGQTMIQVAIAERSDVVFNLLCESIGEQKATILSRDYGVGNTLLHDAAKLAPSVQLNKVSGAALQMQREVQWFKGVENIIPEKNRFKRNKEGNTAQSIFTEKHKDLVEKGEKWLKDTSGSCMVVAALVATIAFAAVFTVPGGNISDNTSTKNGIPVFLGKPAFTIFVVADALSLFSSISSVLMFLAIYTSRYAEGDFLKSLPQKLIIGLATLFLSMATILVAFGTALFIMLVDQYLWVPILLASFSGVPLILFAWLQLPLFLEMIRSTYWGTLFWEHRYIEPSVGKTDNGKKKN
ncbi:ankyrin repeat-containing protein At5g02620-like isoform X2 [Papaver somniferum]|uniref:ankyrin repeat-containing protein At5g02620-like isoform X2 n=1 Tax=Papaver somniferum TaxID=3469 RepID=UPI000E705B0B|nr:ankyrin repeat-containing protein At5g02620-like isoform X2 [Papaver somniferum]